MTKLILFLFLNFLYVPSNYMRIPLEFSEEIPTLQVEIQGKTYFLILDLGVDCEFALKKDVLDSFPNKELVGAHKIISLDGEETTFSKYLFQRIRLKNGEIIHTIVEEDNKNLPNNVSGRIGRNTLQTSNLFIDFSKSLLVVLKKFDDLKREGYSMKDFQAIPFEMTRWGVVFTIETDFGFKRFFINTHTDSAIRNPRKTENQKITSTKFKIGSVDLGETNLDIVEISPTLDDIDGYLGIDFFKKYAIFFDYQNKKALLRL